MKRFIHLAIACFLYLPIGLSQTDLSGIINDYTAVSAIDPCLSAITVANISLFQAGDRVLLIQMQGASMLESDNASFGNISDLGEAGRYEKGTIQGLIGNEVFLQNTLLHNYAIAGKVQLVRIPVYENAQVSGVLTGKAWDGQTGGIIAFEVNDQLSFLPGGAIDATGIGFRGGVSVSNLPNNCSWINQQDNYFYAQNSWRGAAKGEGVAAIIAGKEAGRGAQANGGGGGNDHNSGGGGGAHLLNGGQGGNNEEPSTFGCKGRNPGIGGKGINASVEERVFMGGGGGAGHGNNNFGSNGAAGGGIVFIAADQIRATDPLGTSYIRIAGANVAQTAGDGAGGGGAAGSLFLESSNITLAGTIEVVANGGEGGTVDNSNNDRCFGPGGGGSGGLIAIAGPSGPISGWNVNLSGGTPGLSINSIACPPSANQAESGATGESVNFSGFQESTTTFEALSISTSPQSITVCPNEAITFTVTATGLDVNYQWEMDDGSGFMTIANGAPFSGATTSILTIDPANLALDGATFRCIVNNSCFGSITSNVATLTVLQAPNVSFSQSIMGSTVTFTNLTTGSGLTYLWDFGDGQTSTATNPVHTYAMDGVYIVSLTASNACSTISLSLQVSINTVVAPQSNFSAAVTEGCSPLTVQFTDQSLNAPTAWEWTFPGGTPATSILQNPQVVYTTAGVYDVTLRVSNSAGNNELTLPGTITVLDQPTADFSFGLNGNAATFVNLSQGGGLSYLWDFGDGQTSTQFSPMHTYTIDGSYSVSLTVTNSCGNDVFQVTVIVTTQQAPTADFTFDLSQGCAPFSVQFSDLSLNDATTWQWTFPGGSPSTSIEQNPIVTYNQSGLFDVILEVTNATGTDLLLKEDAIQAEQYPSVAFTSTRNDYTLSFNNTSQNAQNYTWNFGDGSPLSNEVSPTHTYATDGIYQVTLTASNTWCTSVISETIALFLSGIEEVEEGISWAVYPNPAKELVFIDLGTVRAETLRIFASDGRLVRTERSGGDSPWVVDLNDFAPGLYCFLLEGSRGVVRVIVF